MEPTDCLDAFNLDPIEEPCDELTDLLSIIFDDDKPLFAPASQSAVRNIGCEVSLTNKFPFSGQTDDIDLNGVFGEYPDGFYDPFPPGQSAERLTSDARFARGWSAAIKHCITTEGAMPEPADVGVIAVPSFFLVHRARCCSKTRTLAKLLPPPGFAFKTQAPKNSANAFLSHSGPDGPHIIGEEVSIDTTDTSRMTAAQLEKHLREVEIKRALAVQYIRGDPKSPDVRCGRNSGKQSCDRGNKSYRRLIERFRAKYAALKNDESKSAMVNKIIRRVESSGGRFVSFDRITSGWYIAYESTVRPMIHRDLVGTLMKKSAEEKHSHMQEEDASSHIKLG